jgi:hypothetical protein
MLGSHLGIIGNIDSQYWFFVFELQYLEKLLSILEFDSINNDWSRCEVGEDAPLFLDFVDGHTL